MSRHTKTFRAYKAWRWDHTDWYTGKIKAVAGRTLTAPDWKGGFGPEHCGNGFHSHPSPKGCFKFVHLGPISEVEIIGDFEKGDKIRSEKIRVVRWLSDAELAAAAQERWGADYSEVIPLVRQYARNPLRATRVTRNQKSLLKEWASVWASVSDSVSDSVSASVLAFVWSSVWDSVWASVSAFFVLASVSGPVLASAWASLGACCRPWVYKWRDAYPFQSGAALWLSGCVPSFDGKIWRLYGDAGRVIYEVQK